MASYVYPYGTRRERYAILRAENLDRSKDSSYFNYRQFLNFEETDLAFFDPYIDYVLNFLNENSVDSLNYYFKSKNETDFNILRNEDGSISPNKPLQEAIIEAQFKTAMNGNSEMLKWLGQQYLNQSVNKLEATNDS